MMTTHNAVGPCNNPSAGELGCCLTIQATRASLAFFKSQRQGEQEDVTLEKRAPEKCCRTLQQCAEQARRLRVVPVGEKQLASARLTLHYGCSLHRSMPQGMQLWLGACGTAHRAMCMACQPSAAVRRGSVTGCSVLLLETALWEAVAAGRQRALGVPEQVT
jgi:hypothetical protein